MLWSGLKRTGCIRDFPTLISSMQYNGGKGLILSKMDCQKWSEECRILKSEASNGQKADSVIPGAEFDAVKTLNIHNLRLLIIFK